MTREEFLKLDLVGWWVEQGIPRAPLYYLGRITVVVVKQDQRRIFVDTEICTPVPAISSSGVIASGQRGRLFRIYPANLPDPLHETCIGDYRHVLLQAGAGCSDQIRLRPPDTFQVLHRVQDMPDPPVDY